jgi:serine phosphatase RsbU (regulator of sigma subunit)
LHLGSRELIDFIYQDVMDFTDGHGADDDITFFIIKAIENKVTTNEVKRQK